MSLLFETIRIVDGQFQNSELHNARLNESRKSIYHISEKIELENSISIPGEFRKGIYKCKVMYGKQIDEVTFSRYIPRRIKSLQLINDDTISYNFKYIDREHLNRLVQKCGKSDEILIVKNGLITDTSFSNIIFLKENQWVTSSRPLLPGTMRAHLLRQGRIVEQEIKTTDLKYFRSARLINAMLPFESEMDIPIENINLF